MTPRRLSPENARKQLGLSDLRENYDAMEKECQGKSRKRADCPCSSIYMMALSYIFGKLFGKPVELRSRIMHRSTSAKVGFSGNFGYCVEFGSHRLQWRGQHLVAGLLQSKFMFC
jgi:hypothetical protein